MKWLVPKWLVQALLLAALLLPLEPAWARARATPRKSADKARAKKLFARGNKRVRQRRYKLAIQDFKQAHGLWSHPTILYNWALAHAFAGELVQAATQLRRYLKAHPPRPGTRLPKVLRKVLASTGVLVIQLPDAGAAIHVDGRLVGRGRAEVVVLPGRHAIDVRVKDRVVTQKMVMVEAGKEKNWELAELPRPRETARPEPAPRPRPRPGGPGVTPAPAERGRKGIHWAYFTVAASLTAASLGAAIAFSVLTKNAYDDNMAQPSPESKDRGERLQLTANVLWGVTGALAVTATLLAIFTRFRGKEQAQKEGRVVPTVYPGGVGLSLTW